MNSHVPLARLACEGGGSGTNSHVSPARLACEEGEGGAAPLKCKENLAREVVEAEIHLQLAFAREGGGRRRNGGKMR